MLELLIYSQFCKLQAHFELEQFDSDQVCLFNQVEETRLGRGEIDGEETDLSETDLLAQSE